MIDTLEPTTTEPNAQPAEHPAARTIQQRVYDAIPKHPEPITLGRLYLALPYLDCRSIQRALDVLKRSERIEKVTGKAYTYRRIAGAYRPGDARGRPRLVLKAIEAWPRC